jgi:hypothetical protein
MLMESKIRPFLLSFPERGPVIPGLLISPNIRPIKGS